MKQTKRKKIGNYLDTTKFLLIFSLVLCNIWSCKHKSGSAQDLLNHPQQGTLRVCADESFEPIISQQILVFESSFPKAHIIVKYEPESDCFRDFQRDSTDMIVVARGLTKDESDYYHAKLGHYPQFSVLAFDAVSVVVNAQSDDSTFSLQRLYHLLTDATPSKWEAVVDGDKATSTVRYLMDSVAKGKPLGVNVKGVHGSKAVLDAVAANPNAIGFVGSSWIGNGDYDPAQRAYENKVHLAYVQGKKDTATYAKPSQATVYSEQYPLWRPLYCVLKDDNVGVGTSFYNFMSFERGQLIFRVGNLVPAKMDFTIRTVK